MTNQCDKDEIPWHRKEVNLLFVDESLGKELGQGRQMGGGGGGECGGRVKLYMDFYFCMKKFLRK